MKSDLKSVDLYETHHLSPITDYDYGVLVDLYMPLVGASAIGAYLRLLSCADSLVESHEAVLKRSLLSIGEWVRALLALEAVGLVETRLSSTEKFRLFSYYLYAPKSPRVYFSDPLFATTLLKSLGTEETSSLAKKYANPTLPNSGEDVSETFEGFFSSSLSPSSMVRLESGGKLSRSPKTLFSLPLFLSALKEKDDRAAGSTYSDKELLFISHLSSLYGYSEEAMADFAYECSDLSLPVGERLNGKKLEKECLDNVSFTYLKTKAGKPLKVEGDSSFANLIRAMEKESPVSFLTHLQKGHKIASGDASLLEELTGPMGLPYNVANALIFYTLTKKNNTLPRAFITKVAASLVREGVTNSLDAINYLNRSSSYSRKKSASYGASGQSEATPTSPLPSIDEAIGNDEEEPTPSADEILSRLVFKKKERE